MHFRNVTVAFALSVVLSLTQGRVAAQTQTVQREIVGHVDGPLLVIAGPGSGKTYSIVLRALNLLLLAKALPRQIVLCTFTEKAAFEMRDRLAAAARKVGYSGYVSCSVYRRVLLGIVLPTEERGTECLEVAGLAPGDVIGVERVRQRPITAEKAAINAVLAGCLPAYMPVVVAVLRARCDEKYNLHGTSASTGGTAPFIVVNGPVRMLIGMNATHNVLANGNRPNATIGRAIRLALINLLGVIPGEIDRSTLGHPGKFTFCIAEDEENSPWTPLAQERDILDGESAVTVLAAGAPRQVMNEWTHDPEEILETFAAEMRHNMLTYSVWPGNYFLVIPKQLRDLLVAAGWQKHDIQEYMFRSARVLRGDWAKVGKTNIVDRSGGPTQEFTAVKEPSDLLVVAAGGPVGGFGAVIPPWLGSKGRAVTKAIEISTVGTSCNDNTCS